MTQIHRKSRFGCLTCRKRKVKCDETQPACRKCASTGRNCEGPVKNKFMFVELSTSASSSSSSVILTPGTSNSQSPPVFSSPAAALDGLYHQLDPSERRAFDFFLARAAPCLAATQDGSFWTSLVPQVIRSDEAVRSAVLAISCMFEHPPETSRVAGARQLISTAQCQAIRWQCKSIHGFQASLDCLSDKAKLERALLSCVLLTTIEFQQNNVHNALMLLKHGYDMTNSMAPDDASKISDTVKGILIPILARQTVLTATFNELPPKQWFERFQSIAPTSITTMSSLTEARAGLYTCLWKGVEFIHTAHTAFVAESEPDLSALSPLRSQQAELMQALATWDKHFFLFIESRSGKLSCQEELAVATMIMYWNVAHIWSATTFDPTHMDLDKHMQRFERIIECAQGLLDAAQADGGASPAPFSFEMGVIPPLFFTGQKCRHPLLRRRALELLKRAPKQEALYAAEMNARAVEKIIELEEDEALRSSVEDGTWSGVLPSQQMRCEHSTIMYELRGGIKVEPQLTYLRGYGRDVDGKPYFNRGAVPLFQQS